MMMFKNTAIRKSRNGKILIFTGLFHTFYSPRKPSLLCMNEIISCFFFRYVILQLYKYIYIKNFFVGGGAEARSTFFVL